MFYVIFGLILAAPLVVAFGKNLYDQDGPTNWEPTMIVAALMFVSAVLTLLATVTSIT